MGKDNAKAYGRRSSPGGAVLVRIKPTKIIAENDKAGKDWWWMSQLAYTLGS